MQDPINLSFVFYVIRHLPSLNSWRSLGWTNSGLTVSNHQKSSAMNTITLCYAMNKHGTNAWVSSNVRALMDHVYLRLHSNICRYLYLEHERGVQHVLCCQIATFIQVFTGKFSEQLDVVQAISDGRDFLQANIWSDRQRTGQIRIQLNDPIAKNVTPSGLEL